MTPEETPHEFEIELEDLLNKYNACIRHSYEPITGNISTIVEFNRPGSKRIIPHLTILK